VPTVEAVEVRPSLAGLMPEVAAVARAALGHSALLRPAALAAILTSRERLKGTGPVARARVVVTAIRAAFVPNTAAAAGLAHYLTFPLNWAAPHLGAAPGAAQVGVMVTVPLAGLMDPISPAVEELAGRRVRLGLLGAMAMIIPPVAVTAAAAGATVNRRKTADLVDLVVIRRPAAAVERVAGRHPALAAWVDPAAGENAAYGRSDN